MLTVAFAAALVPCIAAQDRQDTRKPTVDILSSIVDRKLRKEAPEGSLITSQKSWEKLVKACDIKDAPKVDFTKEFLYVATGVRRNLRMFEFKSDDKGDFSVVVVANGEEFPDFFCYAIKSFSREGVKTVNGRELNEEIPRAERK